MSNTTTRRTFLAMLGCAAALVLVPALPPSGQAARRPSSVPGPATGRPPAGLVSVDGWLLRSSDR